MPDAIRVLIVDDHAVVLDLQHQPTAIQVKAHVDPRRVRVSERVLERLLRDAEHLLIAVAAAGRDRVVDVQLDVHAVELAQDLHVLPQRAAEPVAIEVGRPELEDQRP